MYSNEIGTSKPIAFRRQRHLSMKVSERSYCNGKCSTVKGLVAMASALNICGTARMGGAHVSMRLSSLCC